MYNTKLICTYQYYNKELPVLVPLSDPSLIDIDDDMNDLSSELLYKAEFLQLFGIESYDGKVIESIMAEVLNKVKDYESFLPCLKKGASKFASSDIEIGFKVLYSYHYFYITHLCIVNFLETGTMSEENIAFLLKAIN